MRNVLILGSNGFMGSHVTKLLKARGDVNVITASRQSGIDVSDVGVFSAFLNKIKADCIINCAAHVGSVQYAIQNAANMLYDNMQIISGIYKSVQLTGRDIKIINPVSNCSYPGDANKHFEPDYWNGKVHDSVASYGNPRRMIYIYSECFKKQYNIKSVNWLIANAYGPGDYNDPNKVHALNGIIIRLIKARKARDSKFEIWGSGKPTREWCYIEDAAKTLVNSIDIDEQIEPINLAQNKSYSIAEIAEIAAKALDYNVEFFFNTNYADGAPFKILDDTLFRKKHPDFSFTPLSVGIKNTVNYYEEIL